MINRIIGIDTDEELKHQITMEESDRIRKAGLKIEWLHMNRDCEGPPKLCIYKETVPTAQNVVYDTDIILRLIRG